MGKTGGDGDIIVLSSSQIIFDSNDWNIPQTITLSAGEDNNDAVDGNAPISLSSPGLNTKIVTAIENDNDFLLTLTSSGNGSVNLTGASVHQLNDPVIITAIPDVGYSFSQWTGDIVNIDDVANAVTIVTMAVDTTITAEFIDTVGPIITFVSPTPENNTTIYTNTVSINVDINEDVANSTLHLTDITSGNPTQLIPMTAGNNGSQTTAEVIVSDLEPSVYSLQVVCDDLASNSGQSDIRQITIDPQQINVSVATIIVPEGGSNNITVSLPSPPNGTEVVTIEHNSGDSDISIQSGATLNFDSGNWNSPQTVVIAASEDADIDDGEAVIKISATGYLDVTIQAIEDDNEFNPSDISGLTLWLKADAGVDSAHRVAPFDDAAISQTNKVFGNASGVFDGTGDYLSISDSEEWDLGSGDFTIEGYVYFNSLPTNGAFVTILNQFDTDQNKRGIWLYNDNGTYQWNFGDYNVFLVYRDSVITTGVWYHVAWVRNNDTHIFYENGNPVGASVVNNSAMTDINGELRIGREGLPHDRYFNGYIDELRILKGFARYTSNFTPTTIPFDYDGSTVLLLHMDGEQGSTVFTDTRELTSGSNVTQWLDQSGASNTVGQAISLNRPVWNENSSLNKPTVTFDGVDDYLEAANGFVDGNSGQYTIFSVFEPASFSSFSSICSQVGANGSIQSGDFAFRFDTMGKIDAYHWTSNGNVSVNRYFGSDNYTTAEGYIGILRYDSGFSVYRNAALDSISSQSENSGGWDDPKQFRVGTEGLSSGNSQGLFDGNIAELIVYDSALGHTDRGLVETYLSDKYSIPLVVLEMLVSPQSLMVPEGSTNNLNVSLSKAPESPVIIDVNVLSGDSDITISSGNQLSFDTLTWNIPQMIDVAAAEDNLDADNGSATIALTSISLSDVQVMVSEVENDFTLTININGNGSTMPSGLSVFQQSDVVNIDAIPDFGYHFLNWSGDTQNIDDANLSSTAITMIEDTIVTANFSPNIYSVTTSANENGSVTGAGNYSHGSTVTLDAIPNVDFRFVEWTGDIASNVDPLVFTITGAINVTATFERIPPEILLSQSAISVSEGGNESFTVTLSKDPIDPVTVTAEKVSGDSDLSITQGTQLLFTSLDWFTQKPVELSAAEDDADADNGLAIFELTSPGLVSKPLSATEVDNDFILTLSVSGNGTVIPPGSTVHVSGAQSSIEAVPDIGYHFVNWTGDIMNVLDINSATTTVTMNANLNITANFLINEYDVTLLAENLNTQPTVQISSPMAGQVVGSNDVQVSFNTPNWTVGAKGQTHIHFHIDNSSDHLMFYNAPDNVVELNQDPGPTLVATWIDANTIQFNNLSDGYHTIRAHLATASHDPPGNPEADVTFSFVVAESVVNIQPTASFIAPLIGQEISNQDVLFEFETPNWTIGGKGQTHIHFHVDGSADHLMFFNAPDNSVEFNQEAGPTALATWVNSNSVQINNLDPGFHTLRGHLATAGHSTTGNPEADVTIPFIITGSEHGSVLGAGTFTHGSVVTLTAVADNDYRFVEWSGDFSGNTDNPLIFTIVNDVTIRAVFEKIPPDIVLTPFVVSVPEGGTETFTVTLSEDPITSFTVTIEQTSGDPDISVVSGAELNFHQRHLGYSANRNACCSGRRCRCVCGQHGYFCIKSRSKYGYSYR